MICGMGSGDGVGKRGFFFFFFFFGRERWGCALMGVLEEGLVMYVGEGRGRGRESGVVFGACVLTERESM